MIECDTTTRKWGNSLGITLPKEVVAEAHLKENDKLKILILKKNDAAKRTFGMFKNRIKEPTQKIKDELRKELYD